MTCIFYMNANHTMYILNLYVGKNWIQQSIKEDKNWKRQQKNKVWFYFLYFIFHFFPFQIKIQRILKQLVSFILSETLGVAHRYYWFYYKAILQIHFASLGQILSINGSKPVYWMLKYVCFTWPSSYYHCSGREVQSNFWKKYYVHSAGNCHIWIQMKVPWIMMWQA